MPRAKLAPVRRTNQLMLYMEIMAYSFNNLTEHRNVMCGQNAELLVLNLVAPVDFKM